MKLPLPTFLTAILLSGAAASVAQSQHAALSHTQLFRHPVRHTVKPVPQWLAARSIASTVTVPGRSVQHEWSASTNQWVDGSVASSTYDARANLTQVLHADSVTNAPLSKEVYTYDAQDQLTEYVFQSWMGSAYVNEGRNQLTYDTRGNLTQNLYQEWAGNAWVMRAGERIAYTYNAAGVTTSEVYESYDNDGAVWENDGRATYTVNASNQWSEIVIEQWTGNAYRNEERIRAITWHDWAGQKPLYYESQEWGSTSSWGDDSRTTFTYQSNGSYVAVRQEAIAAGSWVNLERQTTTYDNYGNEILNQYEEWDNAAWSIESGSRTLLSYTAANQVRRAVDQRYDSGTNRYQNEFVTTFGNFTTLGTRRATALEAPATLHPNPTASTTTISLRGLHDKGSVQTDVLNTLGQVVQTMALQPQQGNLEQELNLVTLPAGVYTVRLHTAEGTIAKRVVKQ
jgi:hypothetical protein